MNNKSFENNDEEKGILDTTMKKTEDLENSEEIWGIEKPVVKEEENIRSIVNEENLEKVIDLYDLDGEKAKAEELNSEAAMRKKATKLKLIVVFVLFLAFLIFAKMTSNKVKEPEIILNNEVVASPITSTDNKDYLLDGTADASAYQIVVQKFKSTNEKTTLEEAFSNLYQNNRYIVDEMIRVPLRHNQDNAVAPYYVVEDKDYNLELLTEIFEQTYTKEFISNYIFSQDNPIYFETDYILYYNDANKLKGTLLDIDWATMEKEVVVEGETYAEYKIHTREVVGTEGKDIVLTARLEKTAEGWRLLDIIK